MKRVITAMAVGLFLVFALSIKIAQSKQKPADQLLDCKNAIANNITQIQKRIRMANNPGGKEFVSDVLEARIEHIWGFARYLKGALKMVTVSCYEGECELFGKETESIIKEYNKLPRTESTQSLARPQAKHIQNVLKHELKAKSPYPKILDKTKGYVENAEQKKVAEAKFNGLVAKHSGLINATIKWLNGISQCTAKETDRRICGATLFWLSKFLVGSPLSTQVIMQENNKYELEKELSRLYADHIEKISAPDTTSCDYSSCGPKYGSRGVSNVTMIDYYHPVVTKTYKGMSWVSENDIAGWKADPSEVLVNEDWELPIEGNFDIGEVEKAANIMAINNVYSNVVDRKALRDVREMVAGKRAACGEYKNKIYFQCKQSFTEAITEINNVLRRAYTDGTIFNFRAISPIQESDRMDNYTETDPYIKPFAYSYKYLSYPLIPEAAYTYNPPD